MIVNDSFQQGYEYFLVELEGQNFDSEFNPELTPSDMLELGVFGGSYFNKNQIKEFPKSWFKAETNNSSSV